MYADAMARIRTKYNTLSTSQKQVADYVTANPEKVMLLTLADFASACGVSEPTIMRFLHKIGYQSYQVFRVNVAQNIARNTGQSLYSDVEPSDTSRDIMNKVLSSTKCSLDDLPQVLDPDALELCCQSILRAEKMMIIGVGSSYAIAFDFCHKLLKLGFNVQCHNDPHIINIASSNLTANSLLIAISHSGESREILDATAMAKTKACPVCAITSFATSNLAKTADITIVSSSHETNYRSDAMTSRIIQLCIIDMIYIRLALSGGMERLERINTSRVAVAQNKT